MAKFKIGDRIFGKVKGHSWWPAKVLITNEKKKSSACTYEVVFYGTFESATLRQDCVRFYEDVKAKFGQPKKSKEFNEAIRQIEHDPGIIDESVVASIMDPSNPLPQNINETILTDMSITDDEQPEADGRAEEDEQSKADGRAGEDEQPEADGRAGEDDLSMLASLTITNVESDELVDSDHHSEEYIIAQTSTGDLMTGLMDFSEDSEDFCPSKTPPSVKSSREELVKRVLNFSEDAGDGFSSNMKVVDKSEPREYRPTDELVVDGLDLPEDSYDVSPIKSQRQIKPEAGDLVGGVQASENISPLKLETNTERPRRRSRRKSQVTSVWHESSDEVNRTPSHLNYPKDSVISFNESESRENTDFYSDNIDRSRVLKPDEPVRNSPLLSEESSNETDRTEDVSSDGVSESDSNMSDLLSSEEEDDPSDVLSKKGKRNSGTVTSDLLSKKGKRNSRTVTSDVSARKGKARATTVASEASSKKGKTENATDASAKKGKTRGTTVTSGASSKKGKTKCTTGASDASSKMGETKDATVASGVAVTGIQLDSSSKKSNRKSKNSRSRKVLRNSQTKTANAPLHTSSEEIAVTSDASTSSCMKHSKDENRIEERNRLPSSLGSSEIKENQSNHIPTETSRFHSVTLLFEEKMRSSQYQPLFRAAQLKELEALHAKCDDTTVTDMKCIKFPNEMSCEELYLELVDCDLAIMESLAMEPFDPIRCVYRIHSIRDCPLTTSPIVRHPGIIKTLMLINKCRSLKVLHDCSIKALNYIESLFSVPKDLKFMTFFKMCIKTILDPPFKGSDLAHKRAVLETICGIKK